MEKRLHTTSEAAALLDVTPARVRQMVARGEIAFERIGRDNFVTAEAVAEAQKRKTKPGPTPKPKGSDTAKKRATKKGGKK